MKTTGKTDKGRKRSDNQDGMIFRTVGNTCGYAIVCDGMGGQNGGEIASRVALHQLEKYYNNICGDDPTGKPLQALMKTAVEKANRSVYAESLKHEELKGMGTTVVAALCVDRKLYVIHVGDSRAYVYHADGSLKRLTKDHSYVQEMIDRGEITQKQARTNPYKHLITRALGVQDGVQPDLNTFSLHPGDRVLLCSDGLYNMISLTEMKKILAAEPDDEKVCERMVALANENGGADNITVVIMTPEIQ